MVPIMLSCSDALERILAAAQPLEAERCALAHAPGRVLACPVIAPRPIPARDTSAMDGYAVCCGELRGGGPWRLPVAGVSRSGHPAPRAKTQAACRIYTGAEVPHGYDAVIIQEQIERDGEHIHFANAPEPGQNVRPRGEDLGVGAVALDAGTRLGSAQLGLCAALEQHELLVARAPRVTLLCTGDELRAPGEAPREASIPESNSVALAELARRAGAQVQLAPLARDDKAILAQTLRDASRRCDLVVTVGGASVGDHDVVQSALRAAGGDIDFWKVRVKPGKPLMFAQLGSSLVLGLPGNPGSAWVTFAVFAMPLLRALQGDRQPTALPHRAVLLERLAHKPGRRGYVAATLHSHGVVPLGHQSSGSALALARANTLVIVEEYQGDLEPGTLVDLLPLEAL